MSLSSETHIDPVQRAILQREFITAIKDAGLVLMPKQIANELFDLKTKQQKALLKKTITPYKVARLKLIEGVGTTNGVKNYITRNAVADVDYYSDSNGKLQILTTALKRIIHE